MEVGRQHHAVCSIGHHIYVIGGRDCNKNSARRCERYDTLTHTWQYFPSNQHLVK